MSKKSKLIPYQLCPKCKGTGEISSGHIYDGIEILLDIVICDVCKGNKIIPQCVIKEIKKIKQLLKG